MVTAAVVLFWFALIWRLRNVEAGAQTHLTWVIAGLAAMFTIKNTPLGPFLDDVTGITGLQVVVRDSIAIVTTAGAMHLVLWVARGKRLPDGLVAATLLYTLVALAMMAGLFVAVPHAQGLVEVDASSASAPALLFWLAYLIPYAINWFVVTVTVLVIVVRGRTHRSLRMSALVTMGLGASFGVIYALSKIAVVTTADQPNHFFTEHASLLQAVPSFLAIALVACGSLMGSELRLRERYLAYRLTPAYKAALVGSALPVLPLHKMSPVERLHRMSVLIVQERTMQALAKGEQMPRLSSDPAVLVAQITDPRRLWARAITEVLAPPFIVIALLVFLGVQDDAVGWALVAGLFVALLPYLVVIVGVRRGVWKDRMLTTRKERLVPLLSNTGFALTGLALLLVGQAPPSLVALVLTVISVQLIFLAITLRWKISFHAAAAAGAATLIATQVSPWLLIPGLALAGLVCWARVVLHEHTPTQVLIGSGAGALLFPCLYIALHTL